MKKNIPLLIEAVLAEYQVRAEEIQHRSSTENTFLQIHISSFTAIMGGVIIVPEVGHWLLFLIPLEASLFGLWWMGNSLAILDNGKYIRDHIEAYISSLLNDKYAVYWETFLSEQRKKPKKEVFMGDLIFITFYMPSIISLALTIILIMFSLNSEFQLFPLLLNFSQAGAVYSGLQLLVACIGLAVNLYFFQYFREMYAHYCKLTKKPKKLKTFTSRFATTYPRNLSLLGRKKLIPLK